MKCLTTRLAVHRRVIGFEFGNHPHRPSRTTRIGRHMAVDSDGDVAADTEREWDLLEDRIRRGERIYGECL